jgi:hypothetical protein
VETLAHSHCLLLSLALLRSFSPLRNARETEVPAAAGEEDGAAPKLLAGARALPWWSAPPSRGFERGASLEKSPGRSVIVPIVGEPATVRVRQRRR